MGVKQSGQLKIHLNSQFTNKNTVIMVKMNDNISDKCLILQIIRE